MIKKIMKNTTWLNAKAVKPLLDTEDQFNKEHGISKRVVAWVDTYQPVFGCYNHKSGQWMLEGLSGYHLDRVTHFAYITAPKIK
jgi:hypothetical protein